MFSGGNFSFHYCNSVVLAPGGDDAAMLVIMANYEIAWCFIDVVDLIAYLEAELLLSIPNVHVCVSCNINLFSHEDSSWCQH